MRSHTLSLLLAATVAAAAAAAPPAPEAFREPETEVQAPGRAELQHARERLAEHFSGDDPVDRQLRRLGRSVLAWAHANGARPEGEPYDRRVLLEEGVAEEACDGAPAFLAWDEDEYRRHEALYQERVAARARMRTLRRWIEKIEAGTLDSERDQVEARARELRERFTDERREPGDWIGLRPETVTRQLSWEKVRSNFSLSLVFEALRTASRLGDLRGADSSHLEEYRKELQELARTSHQPLPGWAMRCRLD